MNVKISLWDMLVVDLGESFFSKPSQQDLDRLDDAFKNLVPTCYTKLASTVIENITLN